MYFFQEYPDYFISPIYLEVPRKLYLVSSNIPVVVN